MSKVNVMHPSEIWEWYREGSRQLDNGKGFVFFYDYSKIKKDNEEMKSCIELLVHTLYNANLTMDDNFLYADLIKKLTR